MFLRDSMSDLAEKVRRLPSDELSDAIIALLDAADAMISANESDTAKQLFEMAKGRYLDLMDDEEFWNTPVPTSLILKLDVGDFPLKQSSPEHYQDFLKSSNILIKNCELIQVKREFF